MQRTPIRRVGVVGLGRMGLPMARHLVRASFTVQGFDVASLREALLQGSGDSWVLRELHLINLTWPDKDLAQLTEAAAEVGHPLSLSRRVRELIGSLTREELRRLCQ